MVGGGGEVEDEKEKEEEEVGSEISNFLSSLKERIKLFKRRKKVQWTFSAF